jgi:hypothetical protein
MATLSGLQSGFFTDIDVVDVITINGDAGTANQVLTSDGTNTSYQDPTLPAVSSLLTAGTGINITATGNPETISTDIDADTIVFSGNTMEVAKVPNTLTISQNGTTIDTFDGSVAKTIDLEGKYIAGDGIDISGHPIPHIEADTDEITISHNVGGAQKLQVLKVPNALTAGTNITFSSGTTYDGSTAITISSTDTDTTYTGGKNITVDTTPNPDEIDLDDDLTGIDSITFTSTPSAGGTALTGNNYPAAGYQTPMTYFNLLDSTNIVSPYFLHDVYDPSTADADSLSTIFTAVFSSNLKNSFTAQSTSCCIELLIYNYSISGNRWLYLQLGDNTGTEWSVGTSGGGSGTGTRSTARTIQYTDETDKVPVRQTWYLQGLTVGTSYTINPMARTSSTLNYIYAGGVYPAAILRGYYLPTTSGGM